MAPITIIDNACVTLWYHPDKKIVHHQIHKFITGDQFKEFLLAGMDVLIKNKAKKWLSDDQSNSVLKKEDVDWGNQNWFPPTVRAGWKYWAIVEPHKVLAQVRLEELVDHFAKAGVTSKFFNDSNQAMAWLERQP